MLREDYETKFTTLNQPFEVGIPNKNGRLRLRTYPEYFLCKSSLKKAKLMN